MDICASNGCKVEVSLANNRQSPQPCDKLFKKKFKMELVTIRDEVAKSCILDTRSILFKLVCEVHGYCEITVGDIRDSFAGA